MSELLSTADLVGREMVSWLVRMNVWTLALLCTVLVADALLARRVSAAWRIALYAVIPLRLMLPDFWQGPLANASPSLPGEAWSVVFNTDTPRAPQGADSSAISDPAATTGPGLWAAVPFCFLGVACVIGVRFARSARTLRREINTGTVRTFSRDGVEIIEHTQLGPMVFGSLRPFVVVPAALADIIGRHRLDWVLRHEIMHVKRADPALAWCARALCACAWPVLPVWLAAARVRALMEQACDEATVRGADRAEYGEVLLTVAERTRAVRSLPALSFGRGVRARVAALARSRRWSVLPQAAVVIAVSICAVACTGSRSPQAAKTDAPARTLVPGTATYSVEMRIFNGAPAPELVHLGKGQMSLLTTTEVAAVCAAMQSGSETAMLSSPRLIVRERQPASIRIGEEDATGTLLEGMEITLEARGTPDGCEIELRYKESNKESNSVRESATTLAVPRGFSGAFLCAGAVPGTQRLLLISPAKRDEGAGGVVREFPQIMTMINVMTARSNIPFDTEPLASAGGARARRLLVRKDPQGVLLIGRDDVNSKERAKSDWAVIASDADVLSMMDALRAHAGGSVTAAPALITRPGESATVSMDSTDKAHMRVGREMLITADVRIGGVHLDFVGKGAKTVRAESIGLTDDQSILIFATLDDGTCEIYAVRPRLIKDDAGYPYQTLDTAVPQAK